ncbi:hypothetical protein BKA67DRAFT_570587, partial [Truncatella angustata]
MTYVSPFMWLRLKPLLQIETRQEMASWTKAADEGHEMATSFFSTMGLIAAGFFTSGPPSWGL